MGWQTHARHRRRLETAKAQPELLAHHFTQAELWTQAFGYLAQAGSLSPRELRRAVVYGSAMGSYAVEKFSVDRFADLHVAEVTERVREFREMTSFETHIQAEERV